MAISLEERKARNKIAVAKWRLEKREDFLESLRNSIARFRWKRILAGLCRDCGKKAHKVSTLCLKCIKSRRVK